MHSLKYQITTLSPIIISDTISDQNLVTTAHYIKGSNLIGALANLYLKKNEIKEAHKDDDFFQWFISGNVIFSNAVKISLEYDEIQQNHFLPNSLQYNKLDEYEIHDLLKDESVDDITTKSFNKFGRISEGRIFSETINYVFKFSPY